MNAIALLSRLRELGIRIEAVGDRLRLRAPQGSLSDELRAALSRNKQELLFLLSGGAGADDVQLRPTRIPRDRELPLSYAQQRIWFHDQLVPGNASYNIATAVQLRGDLDLEALRQSLGDVVARHESLRSTFREGSDGAVQIVAPPGPFELPLTDLSNGAQADREKRARKAIAAETRRALDLERGPLFKARVLRLASTDHVLVFVMHHIVADDWSIGVLNRDLAAHYEARTEGRQPDVPELPIQYADFAAWQRSSLEAGRIEPLLRYWKPRLSGLETLELPTDRPRPPIQTFRGDSHELELPRGLAERLDELGKSHQATLFTTLLMAFKVLLARYSGQTDIVIGSPVANRTPSEVEDLVGLFVNTLVLRTDLSGDPSIRELLPRVRRTTLDALQCRELPFDRLVEELDPPRDLSRNPLFQVFFALQNSRAERLRLTGLRATPMECERGTSQFDLSAHVWEEPETLRVQFVYNSDLFESGTIRRMLEAYRVLLEGIASNPDSRVSELPLLSDEQRRHTLNEWNDTTVAGQKDALIHTLVEEQARKAPDAIAVEFEGQRLNYRELDGMSNRLAHHLRAHGVGPDVPVGLCVNRGVEMLVALLGILKAGGAYVPLDPDFPRQRLALMLEETRAPVLVTQDRCLPKLTPEGRTVVRLDADWPAIARQPDHGLSPLGTPEDLAYVIFTSGSTGRPKGVEIRHAGVVNFLRSMARRPGIGHDDVMLAVTTLCFDISVLELLLPLTVGARVVIASKSVAGDGYLLRESLRALGATVMQATPATWQMLLLAEWPGEPGFKMLCGGEALPRALANQLLDRGAELWNLYGPTETTVWSAVEQLEPGEGPVSLGRPIDNTRLYVLDSRLEPVPQGVVGELCIGGAGLARGYRNRDEQTTERFVNVSWDAERSERLYRTGDLVRYDGGGRLRFLGRKDQQVKIRGFRIEPGEIESVLSDHDAVEQAAAVVREEGSDKLLVAYVVPVRGHDPSSRELREYLSTRLPDYMIPNAIATLASIPLTPSGKVDRLKLASTELDLGAPRLGDVGPRSPEEESVAAAFTEVLGVDRIGVHDDFFELGGHSLLATRLVSRLRGIFRVELPLRTVFEAPTVAQLTGRIRRIREVSDATYEPMRPMPRDGGQIELSFAQRRLWVLGQMGAGAAYNMHRAFRLRGTLDPVLLERAINAVVGRHEALRTRFVSEAGVPRQVIEDTITVPLEHLDLSGLDEGECDRRVQQRITEDSGRTFDLSQAPLLRTTLARLGEEDHLLLVTIHHIACDDWSTGLLARDLGAFYRAFLTGEEPDLPELPIQYADFAVWQNARLKGEFLETQLGYWKQQLGGELPVLNLSTDRPRPAVQTFVGASHRFPISAAVAGSLTELAREHGVTLAMVLLAAYQALLSRYTGQEDLVVGSPIANRTRAEIEELIGFFVNSVVLRTDLTGNPTFSELLGRVQRISLEAYDHQDLPFERLVYELDPERDLGQNPLFQVVFAMQNAPRSDLVLPGLVIEPFRSAITSTRFDLELYVSESNGALVGQFVYNTDLFDASTIERMAGHLQSVLEGATRNPGARLSELPLLGEEERRRLTVTWNETSAEYPEGSCIHDLIEAQARERPEATAVVYRDRQLTYGELDARANRLAHTLIAEGVGPDTLVGLCVERCPELVIGLLGILKSGGAYVPLDPAYPRQRLRFMLEDSGVSVLLTQEHLLEPLPDNAARTLCLDADWPAIDGASDRNPRVATTPDHLAYAIYTSGSTGQPKGVLLSHRGLCNVTTTQAREFSVGPGTRVLQFSSLSFDASTFDIMMALPNGATLYLGHPDDLRPGTDLMRFLADNAINIVTLPPTALAAVPVDELPALETVTVAGEPCSAELVSRWAPGRRFFNLYGPTETTIWATMARLEAGGGVPHIGRPIANTQVYILDRHLNPVPVGVPGELHIGGVGLARGYHGRPELTAERFIDNPFGSGRLYKTGDLARFHPGGNIEFIGRVDHQVKLRGFRIEPGEIEAVLDEHAAVRESLVLVREDTPGDRRLVAYVVESGEQEQAEAEDEEKTEPGWQAEHVSHWQTLYEQSYGEAQGPEAGTFNIAGWNSSYTGEPIPPDEMQAWVDETVERILATRPERILELGCGTGLLLFRVAPHCEEYLGTDFSGAALDYVRAQLARVDRTLPVRLERRSADDFTDIPQGHFDTVVLNSVVQYFPSAAYLMRVLEGALRVLRHGGRIIVGDVRSLPLHRTFHTSVQLYQADSELDVARLRRRIDHYLDQDQELVVDPELFSSLPRRMPRVTRVDIRPKTGRYDNELSRFRYDVVLYADHHSTETDEVRWLDWVADGLSLESVLDELRVRRPGTLGLRGVPNARTLPHVRAVELIRSRDCPDRVEELRSELARHGSPDSVDPADLVALSRELPYSIGVDASAPRTDGSYDVIFRRREGLSGQEPTLIRFPSRAPTPKPLARYTNDPLRSRRLRRLIPRLRDHVQSKLPDYMVPSAIVVLDSFPTTPSGKVDRRSLPAPDAVRPELGGDYQSARSPEELALAEIWARVLGIERVGVHDNFFQLGGDSILGIQIVAAAREAGLSLAAQDLFQHQTVAQLAQAAASAFRSSAEQGPVTGAVPLTPIQHWFFEQSPVDAHHFNQALFLEATQPLDAGHLREALEHLMTHHDALRSRFRCSDGVWGQELLSPGGATPLEIVDLADVPVQERTSAVEVAAEQAQASLNLADGPLVRVVLFRSGPTEGDRLLFVVHHLVVDAVSWPILLGDLERVLGQLRKDEPARLGPKTTSVREWAKHLEMRAASPEVSEQAAYWLEPRYNVTDSIPLDHRRGENTVGFADSVRVSLDDGATRALLRELPAANETSTEEVLVTALARVLTRWTGQERLLLDLEGHGRDESDGQVDLSRTVGWFTAIYPVLLEVVAERDHGAALNSVREQLRAVPGRGLAFGVARYVARDEVLADALRTRPRPEVAFNYLGRFDRSLARGTLFRGTDWPRGSARSPRMKRAHLIEINAAIMDERLQVRWTYCRNLHRQETIHRVANGFIAELNVLIEHCCRVESEGPGTSDFGWTRDEVDDLLTEVEDRR